MSKAVSLALLSGICFMAEGAAAAAAKPPGIRLKPATKDLLLEIKEAGVNGMTITDVTQPAPVELFKHKLLLINETTRSGNSVAVALSPAGVAKADSYRTAEPANPRGPQLKPDDFVIETVQMPDFTSRRGAARQVYPFDKLAVGQSFFIPAPAGFEGDPAKAKQSTISAQNKRSREAFEALPNKEEGAVAPQFKIANDTRDGVKGSRVFRVQ